MAENGPLCTGHVAFRLPDRTAYRMSSPEFLYFIHENADDIVDECTNRFWMNPAPNGENVPYRSCETCEFGCYLDAKKQNGADMRFVHAEDPRNPIPENLCTCDQKTKFSTEVDIAVPFIERETGIVFQAIQGACAFYRGVVSVFIKDVAITPNKIKDGKFNYVPLSFFRDGRAKPKDYRVGRVEGAGSRGLVGKIKHGIQSIIHRAS